MTKDPTSNRKGGVTRFAPSLTGFAHPGTLFSALLVWCTGQKLGLKTILRLDDLDRPRYKSEYEHAMLEALDWLGIGFDETLKQSTRGESYQHHLDLLLKERLLYSCQCTRKELQARSTQSPDGGWAYDNKCRAHTLHTLNDSNVEQNIRVALKNRPEKLLGADGKEVVINPHAQFGDPIAIKKDLSPSYHFSTVVDDIEHKVTHIIRGADLFYSSFIHSSLYDVFDAPKPTFYFHPLILSTPDTKMSKSHKSLNYRELKKTIDAEQLLGLFAQFLGIKLTSNLAGPGDILEGFAWKHMPHQDIPWPSPPKRPVSS